MERKILAVLLSLSLLLPLPAFAVDQGDLMQKIDELSKELDRLKQQMTELQGKETVKEERITNVEKKTEDVEKKTDEQAAASSWFKIGGDYRARLDSLHGSTALLLPPNHVLFGVNPTSTNVGNDTILTNRFGLNMTAKATEDVLVHARLLMYKVWGEETAAPTDANSTPGGGAFFADKFYVFDGNVAHIPEDNTLRVDQAYASWSNILGQPIWFSIGRRPSTGGVPTNLRQNAEKIGTAGTPGLLIDYAFDGGTLGVAPDIDALPGAYAKFCFGKGFDSGYSTGNSTDDMKDVWMIGFQVAPIDTDNLHIELQYNRALDIFAFPETDSFNFNGTIPAGTFGPGSPALLTPVSIANQNIGDIDQLGGVIMGKIDKLGIGDLNLFLSPAVSQTHPNGRFIDFGGGAHYGLMWDTVTGTPMKSYTGEAIYLGERYDIASTGTKLGLEYNHGSKNWITFTPASDDMWTSKLGARGNVYEAYVIQGLNKKPIAKRGNAFFRLGYQYYSFTDTGSNNWVGGSQSIKSLNTNSVQLFAPLKNASDVYLTFDVLF